MKNSSSLILTDQKAGRSSLVTYRTHFRSWPGACSDHSRMEKGTSFQGSLKEMFTYGQQEIEPDD